MDSARGAADPMIIVSLRKNSGPTGLKELVGSRLKRWLSLWRGGVIGSAVSRILTGDPVAPFIWVIGISSIFLSSVAAWLRKKLE